MERRRLKILSSRLLIKLILPFLYMFIAVGSKAQKQLSGLVIDTNGQPVMSASVIIQSSDTAERNVQITVTDVDGKFLYHSVSFPYQLIIQHMSYSDSYVNDSVSNVRVVLKENTPRQTITGDKLPTATH